MTDQPIKNITDLHRAIGRENLLKAIESALVSTDSQANGESQEANRTEANTAENKPKPPLSVSIGDIHRPPDNADELIKHRWFCRGGSLLFVGQTGMGKSVLGIQLAAAWSLGRACFDLQPAFPIRSTIIQAENDDGDIEEMRDGVIRGLNMTQAERAQFFENVRIRSESCTTGVEFVANVFTPIAESGTSDLIWIDPAFAYAGCGVSDQAAITAFLRNMINPVIQRTRCGVVLIHHPNKPPTKSERGIEWSGNDFAYLGSGSIEWANWARATMSIEAVKGTDIYRLRLGKRRGRPRWHEEDGTTPRFIHYLAHSGDPDAIYWRDADSAPEANAGRPKAFEADEILEIMGGRFLTYKKAFKLAEAQGWSNTTFKTHWRALKKDQRIKQSALNRNEWGVPNGS